MQNTNSCTEVNCIKHLQKCLSNHVLQRWCRQNSQVFREQPQPSWPSPLTSECWSVYQEQVCYCASPQPSTAIPHIGVHQATRLAQCNDICSPIDEISLDPAQNIQTPGVHSSTLLLTRTTRKRNWLITIFYVFIV